MKLPEGAQFSGLVDLLSEEMGGRALATNDDFFAGMENLTKPGRGVFLPDEYTERGKWMDGWESRRKRGEGHDWCVLALGVKGRIRALDIDTNHFLGNHPPFASVEATRMPKDSSAEQLEAANWTEILPQSSLRPGSQNLFAVDSIDAYSHVRLHIYPDGGVARFRVYGEVEPDWKTEVDEAQAPHMKAAEADLVASKNGGLALVCSDMFFGPMNNLIAPGRASNMGEGWETRRRRGPGHDWIILRLGAAGSISLVEVDTSFFKGNFPDRCSIEGIHAPGVSVTDLLRSDGWKRLLPPLPLKASYRHFFRHELEEKGPFTHVRLNIFPDGGISRLRLFGHRQLSGVGLVDGASEAEAAAALLRCCGASRWVEAMLARRPFGSNRGLLSAADEVWAEMKKPDILEAFSHHPQIGSSMDELKKKFASTADWSASEQASVGGATEAVFERLRDLNVEYEQKFGYIFIVCATGKSAEQMLTLLEARLDNDPETELRIAAHEQAKITKIRLEKLS